MGFRGLSVTPVNSLEVLAWIPTGSWPASPHAAFRKRRSAVRMTSEVVVPSRWRDPDSNRGHHDFKGLGPPYRPAARSVAKRLVCWGFVPPLAMPKPAVVPKIPVDTHGFRCVCAHGLGSWHKLSAPVDRTPRLGNSREVPRGCMSTDCPAWFPMRTKSCVRQAGPTPVAPPLKRRRKRTRLDDWSPGGPLCLEERSVSVNGSASSGAITMASRPSLVRVRPTCRIIVVSHPSLRSL